MSPGMSSQYLPFAWAETQFQGKTYALPFDTDARALWYNKDLITAAGEDPAKLDVVEGRSDDRRRHRDRRQDQQEGWQRQLRRHGLDAGRSRQPAATPEPSIRAGTTPGASSTAASFADLAQCKVTPTDPGVVAGYQFLYDWAKAHDPQAVSRWVTTNQPPNNPAAQNPFWTGKLAMTISGDWRIAEQTKYAPNGQLRLHVHPRPEGGRHDRDVGRWLVDGADPRLEGRRSGCQVHEVHRRAGRPEGVHEGIDPPSDAERAAHRRVAVRSRSTSAFLDLLPTAKSRPPLAVGAAYWDALTSAQGSVELNSKTPDGRPQGGRKRSPTAARRRRLLATSMHQASRGPASGPRDAQPSRRSEAMTWP